MCYSYAHILSETDSQTGSKQHTKFMTIFSVLKRSISFSFAHSIKRNPQKYNLWFRKTKTNTSASKQRLYLDSVSRYCYFFLLIMLLCYFFLFANRQFAYTKNQFLFAWFCCELELCKRTNHTNSLYMGIFILVCA